MQKDIIRELRTEFDEARQTNGTYFSHVNFRILKYQKVDISKSR